MTIEEEGIFVRHRSDIKVRFSDTDMLGHVNNARYFTFMEESRVHFVEDVLQSPGMPFILAAANVEFRAQTFYPDTLTVETWLSRIGKTSFHVACDMVAQSTGKTVFSGVAVLVHFDYTAQRPQRIPEDARLRLQPYLAE